MRFEVGKFYKHSSGKKISVVAQAETTMYGKTLLAEQCDRPDFMPVGSDSDDYAANWTEITKEEWMECFTDSKSTTPDFSRGHPMGAYNF